MKAARLNARSNQCLAQGHFDNLSTPEPQLSYMGYIFTFAMYLIFFFCYGGGGGGALCATLI